MNNKHYVSELIDALGKDRASFDFLSKKDRPVLIPEVNRVGLELVGFREYVEHKRIIVIGNKEIGFIHQMKEEDIYEGFDFLLTDLTPCIFVSRDNILPDVILDLCIKKDITIIRWKGTTSRLLLRLFDVLDEWFAPSKTFYGTLLSIFGKGVLIKGPSGIGKSEIALELIKKGHNLVSDDSVELKLYDNRIIGKAPKLIQNMIELRGVGILDVTQLFGHSIVTEQAVVDVIIELCKWDDIQKYERLGNNRMIENILGVEIEKIQLPVTEGRSMSDIIEVSVTNFKLQEKGINLAEEFSQRIQKQLKEKK